MIPRKPVLHPLRLQPKRKKQNLPPVSHPAVPARRRQRQKQITPVLPIAAKPQHTHTWVAQTKNVYHEATGHYENKWVEDSAAWDEDQYTEKVVCGCGAVFDNDNQWEHHSLNTDCIYGYSVLPVKTGTIHHEATGHNEQKWVQDSAAWTETVTTGYKCSGCGATK